MNINELIGQSLQDEFLKKHEIVSVLGEGGQGVVCLTTDSSIVIKLSLDLNKNVISKKENEDLYEKLSTEIRHLNKMPFPEGIHIAYPMAVLTDYVGYVMRLMDDMTAFASLMNINNYPETGSYRRRFELLSKVASVLSELHSNGLIYCDLSPNNIFISRDPQNENQNVWLIDADNINISSPKDGKLVYTQRYAAPEIINHKSRCTFSSDTYSYATLAFETLAANHPFDGEILEGTDEGESIGWDATITKSKTPKEVDILYSGTLPWIENPEDKRNHTKNGLPREYFLNAKLFKLFNQTFSEGKESIELRPPMYFWAKAMAEASDTTIACKECLMSHLYDDTRSNCPFCNTEISPILIIQRDEEILFTREINDESIRIPERIFVRFNHKSNSVPFIIINFEKHGKECFCVIKKEDSITTDNYDIFICTTKLQEKLLSTISVSINEYKTIQIIVRNKKSNEEKCFDLKIKGELQ